MPAVSEGLVALLAVEPAAPLRAGSPAPFSDELEADVPAAVEVLDEALDDDVLDEGIAGTWALLRAAQPASQEEARIVTTADARLPI